jgi:hypothetical protein
VGSGSDIKKPTPLPERDGVGIKPFHKKIPLIGRSFGKL